MIPKKRSWNLVWHVEAVIDHFAAMKQKNQNLLCFTVFEAVSDHFTAEWRSRHGRSTVNSSKKRAAVSRSTPVPDLMGPEENHQEPYCASTVWVITE